MLWILLSKFFEIRVLSKRYEAQFVFLNKVSLGVTYHLNVTKKVRFRSHNLYGAIILRIRSTNSSQTWLLKLFFKAPKVNFQLNSLNFRSLWMKNEKMDASLYAKSRPYFMVPKRMKPSPKVHQNFAAMFRLSVQFWEPGVITLAVCFHEISQEKNWFK